ncbi:hypothetical protein CDL15_Pgr003724 [Punica granatum]|uniref:Uncharacterized protein n=1 Tax=Punica granatum TaxID=22663 RepID=A0A218XVK4_PUNGR|nr:hypothetical protein CDL15_Pgr003724 [Punica granatum]
MNISKPKPNFKPRPAHIQAMTAIESATRTPASILRTAHTEAQLNTAETGPKRKPTLNLSATKAQPPPKPNTLLSRSAETKPNLENRISEIFGTYRLQL